MEAEHVPDGSEGHGFHVFHQSELLRELPLLFQFAQAGRRVEEGEQEGLARRPGTDDIGADSVDARIEEIEPDIDSVQRVGFVFGIETSTIQFTATQGPRRRAENRLRKKGISLK